MSREASTETAPALVGPTTGSASSSRKYRPELQGLRALAAMLVVIYHVWLGRISGGVDVFFLISGFLITGQLFRAVGNVLVYMDGNHITATFLTTLSPILEQGMTTALGW